MRVSHPATPRATSRATRLVVVAAGAVALVMALVPELRSPGAVVTAWAGAGTLVLGVVLHRPRPALLWVLLAAVLVLWSAATTAVQVQGSVSAPTAALVGAGQALAVVVTVVVVLQPGGAATGRRARWERRRAGEALVDGVVIATVLGLVTAQVIAVAVASTRSATTVLVPVVDVAVLGMLLRFVVSHRLLPVSGRLVVAAALTTVAHDLSAAVDGDRLPLPGDPAQVSAGCAPCSSGRRPSTRAWPRPSPRPGSSAAPRPRPSWASSRSARSPWACGGWVT